MTSFIPHEEATFVFWQYSAHNPVESHHINQKPAFIQQYSTPRLHRLRVATYSLQNDFQRYIKHSHLSAAHNDAGVSQGWRAVPAPMIKIGFFLQRMGKQNTQYRIQGRLLFS